LKVPGIASGLTAPHATLFLDPNDAREIEEYRLAWDPVMAAAIRCHVTAAYPREVPSLDAMVAAVGRVAAARFGPVRFRLADVMHGRDAVFIAVDDPHGDFARLREIVVGPGHDPVVRPHVTLVHPRTSDRHAEAWTALAGRTINRPFRVNSLAVTAFDGRRWVTVRTVQL